MIHKLIAFSIQNKLIIGLMTLALIVGGIYAINKVPIDAVPDITNNQVQIITQAPNLGTEDVEQFITYPVELAVANLPDVEEIRSISRFGLSVVTVVFDDKLDTYLPRQLVAEKLNDIQSQIPEGFGTPSMGPISTGLGEIYQYTLEVSPSHKDVYNAMDLRSIQDWIIKRQMAMVPGVVEVNAFGGKAKQYEVAIDPNELKALGITINQVFQALANNNQNTGGAYIEKDHQAHFIRGEGLARNLDDIKNIVVTSSGGIPITIRDLADVRFGSATRYGALTKNGQGEAVGGMILMLKGASSNSVIKDVNLRIADIQKTLPEGITITPFLDRSNLISNTTSTVSNNLMEGALIVVFILVFFLGNWRGGLIVASTIPLSLLFAFILMHLFGVWANLMSLGAIDFGIIVDGAVIIVESTVFLLMRHYKKQGNLTSKSQDSITLKAASKMMNTAFFGQFIILIVFLPILALEGVEGKMFKPMALTFAFAMIGAMVLCLTYVPMVTALFLKAPRSNKKYWGERIVHWLESIYEKGLLKVLRYGRYIMLSAILLLGIALFSFTKMGGEFMPQLDEGNIAFHAILKPGSSLTETIATTTKIENIVLSNFPEVKDIISRIGVADVPTDPMPMDIADVFVILKPKSEWVSAHSKEALIDKMKAKVSQIPGVNYEFTQPIEMRFNELITGVREDIAVKLYGEDLDVLAETAEAIGKLVAKIEGVADMKVEATAGQPQITVTYNRKKMAQYGLQINTVNALIQTAFAGGIAGTIFEGEKRFDLVVRLQDNARKDITSVKNLFIDLPNGSQIPLKEIAHVSYQPGPMQISRDNTNRRTYVGINVRGRDIKSLVAEIKTQIEANITLPTGYYVRYGGAFENLERATSKLKTVVPMALGLIFTLIFLALKSIKQTLMIYMAIPLAAIGGVFSLLLRDLPFSISAGVGFIVLFGVAVLNGLVLISGFNELKNEGVTNIYERIRIGTKRRIRPILLTALTDMLGFLPMALSTSSGAEVQRPLATVVIGGLFTATLLTLVVIPILYNWVERLQKKRPLKLKPNLVVTSALLIGSISITHSQSTTLTMEQAVALALEKHPTLEVAQLKVAQEKTLKTTAWDLGTTQVFTNGEELGNNNNDAVYTIFGISQTGIDPFTIAPKQRLSKVQISLAETQVELQKLNLEKQVRLAWSRAYISKKIYSSYQEIDVVFNGLQQAIELRYNTQAISKLEYSAAKNQGRLIYFEMQKAKSAYQIALQKLNQWLLPESAHYDVASEPFEMLDTALIILDGAYQKHPIYQYLKEQQQAALAKEKLAKAQYLPKLSAQYGLQKIGGTSGFNTYQLGLQIPLIFNKTAAKHKTAKLNTAMVEAQHNMQEFELKTQFEIEHIQFLQIQEEWTYYKDEALPLAIEQRKGAILAYKEGAIDYMTFLQTMKNAIQLEIQTWDTLQQYLHQKIELRYYLPTTTKQL